jgi:hypothetical protein
MSKLEEQLYNNNINNYSFSSFFSRTPIGNDHELISLQQQQQQHFSGQHRVPHQQQQQRFTSINNNNNNNNFRS